MFRSTLVRPVVSVLGPLVLACLRLAGLGLAVAATLAAAGARAELPPLPGAEIGALHAFVGDPLLGLEPGQEGTVFGRLPDESDGIASTTKTMTLLLAAELVEAGLLQYDDPVPVSAYALAIAGHGHGAMNGPAIAPGTLFRLEDLLTTMILDSDADATIAVAEHVAKTLNPGLVAVCNLFLLACPADLWESLFVARMNLRAQSLGLAGTLFFSSYGGDHDHDEQGNGLAPVPHESTAREMAIWFTHAMESSPVFRDVIGRQGSHSFQPVGGGPAYSASTSFGYPGVLGQKGGSNDDCGTCTVSMSERAGRRLLVTYMQSAGGDGAPLLDYGFAVTFHPEERGESDGALAPAIDHALACVAGHRAASAVVTPDGDVDVHLWALAADGAYVEPIEAPGAGPLVAPEDLTLGVGGDPIPIDDLALDPRDVREREQVAALRAALVAKPALAARLGLQERAPRAPGPRPHAPAGAVEGMPGGGARQVDVAYTHDGHLAVGVVRESIVELAAWGIPVAGEPFFRAKATVGAGRDVRVHGAAPGLVLVAYLRNDGFLELQTWRIDAATGALAQLDVYGATALAEFRLDGQHAFTNYQLPIPNAPPSFESRFVVAGVGTAGGGSIVTRSYRILVGGTIVAEDSVTIGSGTHVRVVRVEGYHPWSDLYAVAYRSANGDPVVRAYQAGFFGTLALEGSTMLPSLSMQPTGQLEIESYRSRGVLLAVKGESATHETRLAALAIDRGSDGVDDPALLVERTTDVSGGLVGLCRIPRLAAEGDFLLAEEGFFDGAIRLEVWRSAPRQSSLLDCGAGFEGALAIVPPLVWRRRRTRRSQGAAR